MNGESKKRSGLWKPVMFLAAGVLICGAAMAYQDYSISRTAGNCAECHGGFRASPYVSLKDGVSWGDDLHDVHRRQMVDSDCDTCHDAVRFPEPIATSNGGTGWDPIGCLGCHGRAEDGTGVGTEGYGAGLRQHHYRAGETICLNCHADSDPAAKTVVGEDVLPPYYASTGNHPSQPTDPCNPTLTEENYAAATIGLDNDGDQVYDMSDTDCSGVTATPGETSSQLLQPLLVTAHDPVAGTLTLSYDNPCSATDNNLEWGPLADVSIYGYGAQTANECFLGTAGTYVWTYPASTSDIFFLIVGNDGNVEGSLGADSSGAERPEHVDPGGVCDINQDLTGRCD